MKNIGVYCMGLKGLECLQTVLQDSNKLLSQKISFVIISKDKNVVNDYYSEIEELLIFKKIRYFDRIEMPDNLEADFIISISWRWLFNNFLDKTIVFHDSLLPQLRGFNPLVTSLIEGYTQIGVTAVKASESFDKGNIIGFKKCTISYPITILTAIELVSKLYGDLFIEIIQKLNSETIIEVEQDEKIATYSLWRNEDDYRVDWKQDAIKIERFINAVSFPYKGASAIYDKNLIRIIEVKLYPDLNIVNRVEGKIIYIKDNIPFIVCSKGLVAITKAVYDNSDEKVIFSKLRIKLA